MMSMRFLGIGDCCDLSSLYVRLRDEGHEVKVYISDPLCHSTLSGLVDRCADWKDELEWVRDSGTDGIILFENTAKARGQLQDELRQNGLNVIGGSAYGDRLENDRAYAQDVLRSLGLATCPYQEFSDRRDAIVFLDKHPGRYVLKFNGARESFVGRLKDGRDVRAFLSGLSQDVKDADHFILMHYVDGVEMGVGAYFNGEQFLQPSCLDWEHKRFFPGNLGELTYEMGTVVTYERTRHFHELTLGRMEHLLQAGGYCGYINLNTIVNEDGIWPLEFTCRFGYPGYAILDPLQQTRWSDLFHNMVTRRGNRFATKPGFAVGVVLCSPPFPYSRSAVDEPIGLPILFDESISNADLQHIHFGEVGLREGQLVTSGAYGWTMVATGIGRSIELAQQRANDLADRTYIPNARYRRDIGQRLIDGDYARVEKLGLLGERTLELSSDIRCP